MAGLKVLDLFSGIGGFSLGLERTGGFETVAFCEIDKKARLVLKKHWPNVPIFEDVTTLTGDQINDKIDVIAGGFPCQDISLAGKGAGLAGARSGLWYEYHRLIKEIRPSWVIIENVSALRSRGLDAVLRSLAEIGYDAEWHCIPASAVGAPHRRDRIWIIAYPNPDSINGRGKSQFADNSSGEKICNEFGGLRSDVAYPSSDASEQRSKLSQVRGRSDKTEQIGLGSSGVVMADAAGSGLSQWGRSEWQTSATQTTTRLVAELERRGSHVANASIEGSQGYEWGWPTGEEGQPTGHIAQCSWWAVEPDVGRVAHGVPGRVDRLKQLGNAVVPQIPELIGRAILASISEPSR